MIDTGEANVNEDYTPAPSGFDRSGISDFSSLAKSVREAGDAILPLFSRRSSNFGKTATNAAPVSNGLKGQLALLGYSDADIKGLTKGQRERIVASGIRRGAVAERVNAAAQNPVAVPNVPQPGFTFNSSLLIVVVLVFFMLK
jgi:hypothetical protein